jgi:TFIIF-interacting CTD phosphatase-like protein
MMSIYKSDLEKISSEPLTDKCIVLDLDETLVHSHEDINTLYKLGILSKPELLNLRKRTYTIQLDDVLDKKGKGTKISLWGITRPYVKEFLITCFSYFKIVAVWSAGQRKYVEAIVDYLFRDIRRPHIVFTYDDCVEMSNSYLAKPLSNMISSIPNLHKYMSLENTFIIDDRLTTYSTVNPYNGILIPPYKPSPNIHSLNSDDIALRQLSIWLLTPEVMNSTDIKNINKNNIFDRSLNQIKYG